MYVYIFVAECADFSFKSVSKIYVSMFSFVLSFMHYVGYRIDMYLNRSELCWLFDK